MIVDAHGRPIRTQALAQRKSETLDAMRDRQRRDNDYIRGSANYYDAANKARSERPAHWSPADNLSSAAANSPEVRRILRQHVRYEVANNSYAEGIVATDANYVVNKGPIVQFRPPPDADENKIGEYRKAERLFNQWMRHRKINIPRLLRTAWRAYNQDGEPFIRLGTAKYPTRGITLKPELIECDRVETPQARWRDADWQDGIKYENGEPVKYAVLKYHPGDSFGIDMLKGGRGVEDIVRAENMIHWYEHTRPEQKRGIPRLAPALPLYEHLRRWTMATISSAETAASISLYLETNQPPGEGPAPLQPMDTFPIERDMMITMPEGWSPKQIQGTQPNQHYQDFKREIVTEMARCLSMPFNIAGCDSSDYNYASGRLDHQTYFNRVGVDEDNCVIHVITPIAEAWLREGRNAGLFYIDPGEVEVDAFWGGRQHVDPQKVANANAVGLKSGQITLDEIYAEKGLDFETEIERGAQTAGISVHGYKRLIMGNLFELMRDGNNGGRGGNNGSARGSRVLDGIYDICGQHEDRLPEDRIEEEKIRAIAGDITLAELETRLSKA